MLIVVMEPYQINVYYIMKRPSKTLEGPDVRKAGEAEVAL
jgi:hypothetical protein